MSNGNYFEPDPKVLVTSDNNAVIVWQRSYNAGGSDVLMLQKLSPDGTKNWGADGIVYGSPVSEYYGFPGMILSENNDVLIRWTKQGSSFSDPKHIYLQRFDGTGSAVWPSDVPILVGNGTPVIPNIDMISDEHGGAFLSWFDERQMFHFFAFVQHVDGQGNVIMPADGAYVAETAATQQLNPSIVYLEPYDQLFCFYSEQDMNQNNRGLFAQRFTPTGARLWGDGGKSIIDMNGKDIEFIKGRNAVNSSVVFYYDEESTISTIHAMRFDTAGNSMWPGDNIAISTVLSNKAEYSVGPLLNGQWILTWEDQRNADPDIYGQNIQLDGTLGPISTGVRGSRLPCASLFLENPTPNPFSSKTSVTVTLSEPQAITLSVLSLDGTIVKTLSDGYMNRGSFTMSWDGTMDSGTKLNKGIYLLKLQSGKSVMVKKIILTD